MKSNSLGRRFLASLSAIGLLLAQTAMIPAQAAESDMPDFSSLGAVGVLTEQQTVAAAESIYTALKNHSDTAALSTKTGEIIPATTEAMDSLMNVFATVVGGWEVGILTVKNHISSQVGYSARKGSFLSAVNISSLVDDKDYNTAYAEMQSKLDAISAQVQDDWSDVEKALFLHDYLAVHYNYDYTKYETDDEEYYCHTAYNMLRTGKGVCEAYAWLYNLLLEREGIQSFMMTSDTMLHAWNVLNLDGKWVHVDVTWDDGYQEHAGMVRHISFLKDNSEFAKANHEGNDWMLSTGLPYTKMEFTNRYNNGFWADSIATVQYYQDGWLTIVPDSKKATIGWFNLYKYNADTATAEKTPLLSLCEYWTVPGSVNYYINSYIVPAVHDGILYYSTPTSIMALIDGQPTWVYDVPEDLAKDYRIYGMYIDGDTLYYDLSVSSTDAVAKEISIPIASIQPTMTETESTTVVQNVKPTTSTSTTTTKNTTTTSATSTTKTTTTSMATTTTTKSTTTTSKATTTTIKSTTTTPKATTSTTKLTTTTKATTTTTTKPTTATTTTTKAATTTPRPASTTSTTTTASTTTTTTTTSAATSTTEPAPVSGDLDGDGTATVLDVIMMTRCLHGIGTIPPEKFVNADLLADGTVDVFDLALLKREVLQQ